MYIMACLYDMDVSIVPRYGRHGRDESCSQNVRGFKANDLTDHRH